MLSFQYRLGNMASECGNMLDYAAAKDDGCGSGDNQK